ncbi:MAG: DUF5656 family protein [Anaerolineae bacterium]
MPRSDRMVITIGFVMLGLLLASLIVLPVYQISLTVLGSELALRLDTAVQFGLILTVLVCVSVDLVVRSHPELPDRSVSYSATFWILPGILTFSSFMLLSFISWWMFRIVYIGIVGLLLYTIIAMQYRSINRQVNTAMRARLVLQVAVYLAALLFFVIISSAAMRAIVSASAVLVASALLSLELIRELEARSWRIWLYAILIGLMMSEFKWAMNYIRLDARIGGALLLLLFYGLTGLTQSYLLKRLTRRVIIEFGVVTAIGMLALYIINRSL